MNKIEISIDKLIEKITNLKELNILELNSNGLSILPKESSISKLEELCSQLILMDNKFNEFPESILSLTKLKIIRLQNNNLSSIPENISKLTNLREISIENNKFENEFEINNLLKIKSLERIWIDNNSISNIPNINYKLFNNTTSFGELNKLERISICNNKLINLGGIIDFNKLQVLMLNENNIEIIPKEIKNLNQLKK